MKKNKMKWSAAMAVIMILCVGSFLIQPLVVYGTADEETPISNEVENMNDLKMDLIEDVETAESIEEEDNITSSQEDLEVTVSKEEAKIDMEQAESEDSDFSVSIDDSLDYVENEDGTLVYDSQDGGYTVDAQPLDGGARFVFNIENESSVKKI